MLLLCFKQNEKKIKNREKLYIVYWKERKIKFNVNKKIRKLTVGVTHITLIINALFLLFNSLYGVSTLHKSANEIWNKQIIKTLWKKIKLFKSLSSSL